MDDSKCSACHRRSSCALRTLAEQTLPWVVQANEEGTNDWERTHAVRRALRGNGACPGYVEDWLVAGAMAERDVELLVESIVARAQVDMGVLCSSCRHYVGPVSDARVATLSAASASALL